MSTYKKAGVNKEEGYRTVQKIKDLVHSTFNGNVLSEIGSFGAFYQLNKYKNPVLVSGTDGVGTKLKLAFETQIYNTVGIDCFAMCANDILCHGAKPLFFLDYLACGKLDSSVAAEIVSGIVKACRETNTALIGGETAEMPGFYKEGDYDIAGFCVGIVEKDQIINGSSITKNDRILALSSSGVHSNGFSLIRKVLPNIHESFNGQPLYKSLMTPTKLYHSQIFHLLDNDISIKGIAHITGGGLIENVPRILSNHLCAVIDKEKIRIPEIFDLIQQRGNIEESEMWETFNMGVGMIIIVDDYSYKVNQSIFEHIDAYQIGIIEKNENSSIRFH